MKIGKRIWTAAFLSTLTLALAACGSVAAQPTPGAKEPPGITVSGVGEVRAQPDIAYLTVGVQTTADTAQEAQSKNAQIMTEVIARLKGLGIADRDLQTVGLSLSPFTEQPRTPQEPRVTRYRAENRVTVTVRDISQVGRIFDTAVTAGANLSGSLRFSFQDEAGLRREALQKAVQDARAKADAIAKALGVTIREAVSVSEESVSFPRPVSLLATEVGRSSETTPVEAGESAITARVKVTYSF